MSTEELLDQLVVPRPNGSPQLDDAASFIETQLRPFAADVVIDQFVTTPYGFQLIFAFALIVMLGFAAALWWRHYGLGLALIALMAAILLAQAEYLWSPVGALIPAEERNVEAMFPGHDDGPMLILSAHYDTATQFGDHYSYMSWGFAMGAGALGAVMLALVGLARRRRGRELPRRVVGVTMVLVLVPFAAMAVIFSLGPLVRTPSPGALDNGGSVAVLLRLAERLAERSSVAPTTVKLVFFAAEEQGGLGSWHYAQRLTSDRPVAVINLDTVGTGEGLAYAPEEGFVIERYEVPKWLVRVVNEVLEENEEQPLQAVPWPGMAMSDARSFLAHGIPAVTLFELSEGRFPRGLHSAADSRDRLSVAALERMVDLLEAIVLRVDQRPVLLDLQVPTAQR